MQEELFSDRIICELEQQENQCGGLRERQEWEDVGGGTLLELLQKGRRSFPLESASK